MKKSIFLCAVLVIYGNTTFSQERAPPTPPFAYMKNGQVCHLAGKYRFESCRPPNNQEEVALVIQRRKEFDARVNQRILENSRDSNSKSCQPFYSEHFEKHLQEAINGGIQVWGFAGYSSANEYAKARANFYVSLLRQNNVCN
jgi:hypothetical protein